MPGYTGKILVVNLSTGDVRAEVVPDNLYRDFIGGVGLGVRILFERVKAKADALGPDNVLGFVTGPLTGTDAPASARCAVVAKSPLTGTWGDSNCGGNFGPELKAAGYDAIFFSGVSAKPVYLLVDDDKVELRGATHLWGKDTLETGKVLQEELGDPRFKLATIGPAGEKLSLISAILNDGGRAWGRSGIGAVMGSKYLKAVAVRGSRKVRVADGESISAIKREYMRQLPTSLFHAVLRSSGTSGLFEDSMKLGWAPVRNWSSNGPEAMPTYTRLRGEVLSKYQVKRYGCWRCPIACSGIVTVKEGAFSAGEVHKPEYETVVSFGPMCLNDNVEAIIKANDICNRYGLDTISAGTVIAFAMECFERGIIGKNDTNGLELAWGNSVAIVSLLEKIAKREGFGDILADGVKKAAARLGHSSEECAVHFLGQEPGYHDPRYRPGRGTAYVVDATPGRHTAGAILNYVEGGGTLGDYPELQLPCLKMHGDYDSKGQFYALLANYTQLFSSSGLCLFAALGVPVPLPELISAATGWQFSMAEGLRAGWRINTLRQAFNNREGVRPLDVRYPPRLAIAAESGPLAGLLPDFSATRAGYFAAMRWDLKTGKPYRFTLIELGLDELVRDCG